MRIACLSLAFTLLLFARTALAQINAGILAHPHVSQDRIVFTYADDLWLLPRKGGTAQRLSTPAGTEQYARFSPDGKDIVYSANYDGAVNLYRIPAGGGVPVALTSHEMPDRMLNWYPDGEHILFSSGRGSGNNRFNQLWKISRSGGLPERLPLPYGEFGCISPDGKRIAFTTKTRLFRTWKRYRGGLAADIHVFDPATGQSTNITDHEANDEAPMWHETTIYFLSDRGPEGRYNLWSYDFSQQLFRQVTSFRDLDVRFPSLGGDAIVFTAGSKLYLYDVLNGGLREIPVQVSTDQTALMPRSVALAPYLEHLALSPDGKRLLAEARGEIFSVPATHGPVIALTRSSGVAERHPAWSPDGRKAAWFTDRRGEYELAITDLATGQESVVTTLGPGFRYRPWWSPDSRRLVFIDQAMKIWLHDTETGKTASFDSLRTAFHGELEGFRVTWSPDSRWVAYSRHLPGGGSALAAYDADADRVHALTSGYYNDYNPAFDPSGKYLWFTSNRSFAPVYGDFDNGWTYPNATQLAVMTLQRDSLSPLVPLHDTVALEPLPEPEPAKPAKKKKGKAEEPPMEEDGAVRIDLQDIERRVELLPLPAGNYGHLEPVEGRLIFLRHPAAGAEAESELRYWDLAEREEKLILAGVQDYQLSFDGSTLLVSTEAGHAVIAPEEAQELTEMLDLGGLRMTLDPRAEWRQLFLEAWRLQRDYFYDKDMHGVDWRGIKSFYWELLEACATRSDVNFVIGEMIGELNASHAYRGGGDQPQAPTLSQGWLGIDWGIRHGKYVATRILRGGPWDAEVRSPLDRPGLRFREGDHILAVNGVPLDTLREPYAAFAGLGGQTAELRVAPAGKPDAAYTILVELLEDEYRLRHLDWIERNRRYVEEGSNGRVGYIYVTNTGVEGQSELMRQFMGQRHKEALLIDERWNSGGQIPDRFVELLNRKPLAYWAVRDGETWQWPPASHFGPKAMLINGWSGSGGDAFPDYFRKSGLGPLIGTRTWGGLIGISGVPGLIDGGSVTVPTFRMYNPDGTWFPEGHGVDPDITVPEDPGRLTRGSDPQIDRALLHLMGELEKKPGGVPPRPAAEKR